LRGSSRSQIEISYNIEGIIMQGAKDLWASERGFLAIALVVMSGAMVIVGKLDAQTWLEYTKWIGGVTIASKTVTSGIEALKKPVAVDLPEARVVKDA
jgi:hypothetical protein